MATSPAVRWIAATALLALLTAVAGANTPQSTPAPTAPQEAAPASLPVIKGAAATRAPRTERPSIPASFRAVAQEGHLKLYWDEAAVQLAVEDTRSGERWFSTPSDMASQTNIGGLWQNAMRSLFLLTYTDQRFQQTQNTNMAAELAPGKGSLRQQVEAGAITLDFDLTGLGLALRMEISLTESGLLVRVPAESIVESGKTRLVRLEVLPFFGGTRAVTDGYLFVPDGSGALIQFKQEPSTVDQVYAEPVYGGDLAKHGASASREMVRVPVFGLAISPGDRTDGAALVGILTEGAEAGGINAATSGYAVPYYRAWPTFHYRQQYMAVLSRSNRPILFEKEIIRRDRAVLYTFLSGAETTYADMAGAYRRHLVQEQQVPRLPQGEGPLASLRLTGGDLETGAFFRQFAAATTFGEASDIVQQVLGEGAQRINVIYDLWMADGPRSRPPYRWEPEPELGGSQALRSLGDLLAAHGVPLYLTHNYVQAWGSGRGFTPRSDAARGPSKQPFTGDGYRRGELYLINPVTALERYLPQDLARYQSYGVTGLLLEHADRLYSDYGDTKQTDRADAERNLAGQFQAVRAEMGSVAASGFLPYMLGQAEFVQELPVSGSYLYLTDETVPFLQIALHGLIRYGSTFGNLRDEPQTEFLKAVETGALPSYNLTAKPSETLKRTETGVNLYSSQASDWLADFLAEYRQVEQDLAHTHGLFITGHRVVAPNVIETSYEDGTRVLVNYTDQPVVVDGLRVEGQQYAVSKGGGGR